MKRKIFYGWVVCGACTLLIFVTMGTASNGLSVFMPYIRESYGFTNAQTSTLVTLRCAFTFGSMIFIGKYYDLVGYRKGTGIAALLCAAAYFVYSRASTYAGFCLGASLGGISYGLGSMIPVSILMSHWFVKHRALAIGICSAGSGLAVIILPSVLTRLILDLSLKTAFKFVVCYTVIFAVLIFILIRRDPSEKGLEALGKSDFLREYHGKDAEERVAEAREFQDLDKQKPEKLSMKTWVIMGLVSIVMGGMANPGFMHLTMLYSTEGFSPMTVAVLVSVTGIVLTGAKIAFGGTVDRFGGYKATMLFAALLLAGHGICCLSFMTNVGLSLAGSVLLGLGYSVTTVGIPVWAGDLVSEKRYAEVVRKLQLSYAGGAMLFATVPGILADLSGGFISTYLLFGGLIVLSMVCLSVVYFSGRQER